MEPNFEKIVEQLFALNKGEKAEDTFEMETNLEWLESTLGYTGRIAFPHLGVPIEVSLFFDELYEYVKKNNIEEDTEQD